MLPTVNFKDNEISFHHTVSAHPEPEDFDMHTHETCEVYCFISGEGQYRVEGSIYPLTSGTVLIMRPSEAHCLQINPEVPYERCAVHFPPSVLEKIDPEGLLCEPFFNRPLGQNNCYPPSRLDFDVMQFFSTMCVQNQTSKENRLAVLSQLIPLLYLLRSAYQHFDKSETPVHQQNTAHRLVQYINENLESDLSLDLLSSRFYLSKSQLNRIFRSATGESIWNYIVIKRLMDARRKITSGQNPLHVCECYADWDYSAFFRAYKKRFGVSPKEDAKK